MAVKRGKCPSCPSWALEDEQDIDKQKRRTSSPKALGHGSPDFQGKSQHPEHRTSEALRQRLCLSVLAYGAHCKERWSEHQSMEASFQMPRTMVAERSGLAMSRTLGDCQKGGPHKKLKA